MRREGTRVDERKAGLIFSILCVLSADLLLYSMEWSLKLPALLFSALLLPSLFILLFLSGRENRGKSGESDALPLSSLLLLNEEGREIRSWSLLGRSSLRIGRGGEGERPEVDLSGQDFEEELAAEHAVLNRAGGQWYLEDLGSGEGTLLHLTGSGESLWLMERRSIVRRGDLIQIGRNRLRLL